MHAAGVFSAFFFSCYGDHRDLHSFPTRRSSDLEKLEQLRALEHGMRIGVARLTHAVLPGIDTAEEDRKSTRLNSSHVEISYAVFCLKKKKHICFINL